MLLFFRNGIERLRAGVGILHDVEDFRYEPKYVDHLSCLHKLHYKRERKPGAWFFASEVFVDVLLGSLGEITGFRWYS